MLKAIKCFSLFLAICSFLASVNVPAHERRYSGSGYFSGRHYYNRPGFSFYFGWPVFWPPYYVRPYYPYPPYYVPPAYAAPAFPQYYVEPGVNPKAQSLNPDYWRYCPDSNGYYPNVPTCPGGWLDIRQQPAGEEPGYWYYCNNPAGYYPYVRNCSTSWQKIVP